MALLRITALSLKLMQAGNYLILAAPPTISTFRQSLSTRNRQVPRRLNQSQKLGSSIHQKLQLDLH